ncbi:MAG: EAL domain-containing protein [Rhodospirillales bacterium]
MIESAAAEPHAVRQHRGQDRTLLDHLHGLGRDRRGAYGAQLHLSRIEPAGYRPRALAAVLRSLASLAIRDGAQVFRLRSGDVVLVCLGLPLADIDAAVGRVRRTISAETGLSWGDGRLDDPLVTWFDLRRPSDHAALSALAAAQSTVVPQAAVRRSAAARRCDGERPLDPVNLAVLGRRLERARIPDLIRQQTAIRIHPGGRGQPLFRETYVSMSELQARVTPGVRLTESTSLFRYLTEVLDRHVLTTVPRRGLARGREPISLNLNISSLASGEFHLFHKQQHDGTSGGRPVIEIQLVDILADVAAFTAARDTLQDHGYRVLIDGLSPLTLEFCDVSRLGADFVKICWDWDAYGQLSPDRRAGVREIVARTGPDRMLIGRVDRDEAVKWALELGITRFQGRYIDKVIDALVARDGS